VEFKHCHSCADGNFKSDHRMFRKLNARDVTPIAVIWASHYPGLHPSLFWAHKHK